MLGSVNKPKQFIGYKQVTGNPKITKMKFELKPYNRDITDKELLDDLKKIACELNKETISGREYDKCKNKKFGSGTIAKRFNGWNNAIDKAGLKVKKYVNLSDEELLSDIIKVAIGKEKLTISEYNEKGKYTAQTMNDRFGSWNKALEKINLKITNQQNISEIDLFKNLEEVWIILGRQPGKRDLIRPNSRYSESPYNNKFGSWRKALEAFVEYINSDIDQIQEIESLELKINISDLGQDRIKHTTKRDISDRLKVKVLIRDGNKCRLCGITVTGNNIHFDHIKPWSKGGETILENIQVLCAPHNLAKGNYDSEEK